MKLSTYHFLLLALLLVSANMLSAQTCQPGDPGYISVDFDIDGEGNPIPMGTVIDETTYAAQGVHFSSVVSSTGNPTGNYPLVIFDSSSPTGGDCDLGTPSYFCETNTIDTLNDCSGNYPGRSNNGAGGANNCEALGNLIIISENYPYQEIGLADPNPDDLGAGGSIFIEFDNPLTVIDIAVVDDASGDFIFKQSDGALVIIPYAVGEDNDVMVYDFGIEDVVSIEVTFNSSGALSSMSFCDMFAQEEALPVVFQSVEVKQRGDLAELTWATALEQNSDYFAVEKSNDGRNWIEIELVEAAGHSTSNKRYNSIDASPSIMNYYRLRQVDLDQKFIFSEVVSLRVVKDVKLSVFPNPAVDFIQITTDLDIEGVYADIIEASTGKVVNRYSNILENQKIDMSRYGNGLYIVRIMDETGTLLKLERVMKIE